MKRKKLLVSLIALSLIGIVSCDNSKPTSNSSSQGSVNNTSQTETSDSSENISNGETSSQSTVKYTITYYLNDGSDKIYLQEEVPAGSAFTRPTNPTIDGLRFRGWYVDPACLVIYSTDTTGDTSIKADLNLYAKWVVDTTHEQTSSSTSESSSNSEISSSGSTSSSLESSTLIPEGTTYTIDQLPTWITNDGCVIFAWAWEEGKDGEWIETTYTSETSLTFTTNKNIVGLLLARCAPGTTKPDWNMTTDGPGRVYNQTGDMKVTEGVTTYSLPESMWRPY